MSQAVGAQLGGARAPTRIRVRRDRGIITDHEQCLGRRPTLSSLALCYRVLARGTGTMLAVGARLRRLRFLPGALGRVRQEAAGLLPDSDRSAWGESCLAW